MDDKPPSGGFFVHKLVSYSKFNFGVGCMATYNFNIVGEGSYQQNLKKIAGPKQELSKFHQCTARVISEPTNKFDKNAVKVEINGLLVGYLSKGDAQSLVGKNINKSIPAVIDGGWDDEDSEGQYGVKLAINSVRELI